MKKILTIITLVFSLLTLAGIIYVLRSHGTVSAGFACVPMILALGSASLRKVAAKEDKGKNHPHQ